MPAIKLCFTAVLAPFMEQRILNSQCIIVFISLAWKAISIGCLLLDHQAYQHHNLHSLTDQQEHCQSTDQTNIWFDVPTIFETTDTIMP